MSIEAMKQEPVAWMDASETMLSWENFLDGMKPLYTTPPAAQPAPVQKSLTDEMIQDLLEIGNPSDEEMRLIRLGYAAAQRQWVGLDADEKLRVRLAVGYSQFMTAGEYAEKVQDATEAKLREKNG